MLSPLTLGLGLGFVAAVHHRFELLERHRRLGLPLGLGSLRIDFCEHLPALLAELVILAQQLRDLLLRERARLVEIRISEDLQMLRASRSGGPAVRVGEAVSGRGGGPEPRWRRNGR